MISIIMPTFNAFEYVKRTVENIRKTFLSSIHPHYSYEFIIIENNSTDIGTKAYVNTLKAIKVYNLSERVGVAKAWNIGMRAATGDYLMIVNSDILFAEGWNRVLRDEFYRKPEAGIVSPDLLGVPKQVHMPEMTEEQFREGEWKKHIKNSWRYGFHGTFFMIPRAVYVKVGEFDERLEIDFNDADYGRRVIEAGYIPITTQRTLAYHFGAKSKAFLDEEEYRQSNLRSAARYYKKWPDTGDLQYWEIMGEKEWVFHER